MNKRRWFPIRKRSFLLLEVILSFFLIVLCLFPLTKPYALAYRFHTQWEKQLRSEWEDGELLCLLKRDLFEKKYSWQTLCEGVKDPQGNYVLKQKEHTNRSVLKKEGLLLKAKLKNGSEHLLYVERQT